MEQVLEGLKDLDKARYQLAYTCYRDFRAIAELLDAGRVEEAAETARIKAIVLREMAAKGANEGPEVDE